MTFFTGLNRFTVIARPSRHMILWRKFFSYVIVVIVVFPLPFTYHILQFGGYLALRNPQNVYEGYRLDVNEQETGPRNALLMMIVLSIHGTALVLIHLYIAVSLYKRRRNTQRVEGAEDTRDTETMLFLFTAFLLVFSVIFFVCQCLFFFAGYNLTEQQALTLIFIQTVVYDIHTCSAPWALLAMSKGVRREVLKRVGLYNKAIDDRLFTTSGHSGQPT
ncbi:SRG-10 protein [Aphelenchoides avenae]|nr:SRG-10 protein [Aphelenchus avenae]